MNVGAIVLAGGVGSRMRPLTDDCPKPLLPLGAEPLIGYQLRRLAAVGVRRVVVSTGYLAERFEQALGDGSAWGLELRYCVEDEPLGTGGALRAAIDQLPDSETVVALNGDLLSSHDLAGQLSAAGSARVCVHVRPVPDVAAYGRVVCDRDGRVTTFAEKSGTGPGLANAGTYVVDADLLRALPAGRSSWERDVLPALLDRGVPVVAREADGYFRDVGSPAAYRLASVDAVTGVLPGTRGSTSYVAPGVAVGPGAQLSGGTAAHDAVVVERDALVDASVLLAGARVGRGARVTRCVVAPGAEVPAGDVRVDEIVTGVLTRQ